MLICVFQVYYERMLLLQLVGAGSAQKRVLFRREKWKRTLSPSVSWATRLPLSTWLWKFLAHLRVQPCTTLHVRSESPRARWARQLKHYILWFLKLTSIFHFFSTNGSQGNIRTRLPSLKALLGPVRALALAMETGLSPQHLNEGNMVRVVGHSGVDRTLPQERLELWHAGRCSWEPESSLWIISQINPEMTSTMSQAHHQVRGRGVLSVPLLPPALISLLDVGEPAPRVVSALQDPTKHVAQATPSLKVACAWGDWKCGDWEHQVLHPIPTEATAMSPEGFVTLYRLLSKLTTDCFNSGPTSPNSPATDSTSLLLVKGIPSLEKFLGINTH